MTTITAEHLGALALHLAREHHRGRRLRRLGLGARYLVQITGQIRGLIAVSGMDRPTACSLFRTAFELARYEFAQGLAFKGVQP